MHYNKEEVESHLNIVSKYIEFIVSLNNKYIHEGPYIQKKFVLRDLIYYTDESLTIRLCKAFNFIVDNFKKTGNFFLCEYSFLRENRKLNTANICGYSLINIGRVEDARHVLEIVLRVMNGTEELMEETYLKMIT
jgi:hypothetical protein